MIAKLLLFTLLLHSLTAIYLPLLANRPRCMMVYTIGDVESVKIHLNLPELPNQIQEEFYTFSMKNTETNEVKNESINHGSFNKEYDLTPSTYLLRQM